MRFVIFICKRDKMMVINYTTLNIFIFYYKLAKIKYFISSLNFQSKYSKPTYIQVKETGVQNLEKTKKVFLSLKIHILNLKY